MMNPSNEQPEQIHLKADAAAVLLILSRANGPMYADQFKRPHNPEGVSQPMKCLTFAVRHGLARSESTVGGARYSITEQGRTLAQGLAVSPSATPPRVSPERARVPQGVVGAGATPQPMEAKQSLRPECAPDNRNVYCPSYGACVDTAIRKGWEGFSCAECPLYARDNRPQAEQFMWRDTSI
jgi:hypothetical protein